MPLGVWPSCPSVGDVLVWPCASSHRYADWPSCPSVGDVLVWPCASSHRYADLSKNVTAHKVLFVYTIV